MPTELENKRHASQVEFHEAVRSGEVVVTARHEIRQAYMSVDAGLKAVLIETAPNEHALRVTFQRETGGKVMAIDVPLSKSEYDKFAAEAVFGMLPIAKFEFRARTKQALDENANPIGKAKGEVTLKSSGGGARRAEYPIKSVSPELAERLIEDFRVGEEILKIRHTLDINSPRVEEQVVDVFTGRNAGLCLTEIELTSEVAASTPSNETPPEFLDENQPSWVGHTVEKSERLGNAQLALDPILCRADGTTSFSVPGL